jgi:hypothetical protein
LEKWGVKFRSASNRPYFAGHERSDVIASRNIFVDYFKLRENHYYLNTESDPPERIIPTNRPCILICHDETTFRSGEQSVKRCQIDGQEAFSNKGKTIHSGFLII